MKVVSALLLSSLAVSTAFLVAPTTQLRHSFCRVAAGLEERDVLLFGGDDVPDFDAMMDDDDDVNFDGDDDYDDDDDGDEDEDDIESIRKPNTRWSSLHRKSKVDLGKETNDREGILKNRAESKQDKKRREYAKESAWRVPYMPLSLVNRCFASFSANPLVVTKKPFISRHSVVSAAS